MAQGRSNHFCRSGKITPNSHLRMEAFGPFNTKDAGHMKDLAIFVVAFTLVAELLVIS